MVTIPDRYVNKVVYGSDTLIDLTDDTVTSGSMVSGVRAHDASGAVIYGNIPTRDGTDIDVNGLRVTVPSGFYSSDSTVTAIGPTTHEYTVDTDTIGSAAEGVEVTVSGISDWDRGSLPTLGTEISADDITSWSRGTAASATVSNGILTITDGVAPELVYQQRSIPNVTSVGTLPDIVYENSEITTITVNPVTVVTDITEVS